uniref:hypothetical protein n=3 Tax=Bacteroides TaxID=816 RepID=UPI001896FBAE
MKSIRFLSLLLLLNLFAAGGYAADHPVKKEIAVSGVNCTPKVRHKTLGVFFMKYSYEQRLI